IEAAAAQEFQREKRVRRADHAQVDLQRRERPRIGRTFPMREKVDAEGTDDAVRGKGVADTSARFLETDTIVIMRWESTSQIELAGRTTENLIVGRYHHDVARRASTKLRARRMLLFGIYELFDDAAHGRD